MLFSMKKKDTSGRMIEKAATDLWTATKLEKKKKTSKMCSVQSWSQEILKR